MNQILGRMISAQRKRMGLTQVEMSRKIGIHRVTLAKIETGKLNTLTLGRIESLLRRSGLDWFDLAREFLKDEMEDAQ